MKFFALLLALGQDDPVAPGAKVEKVAAGYKFTEGPAADRDGDVWFTDIPNERIVRFDVGTGKAEVAREKSGRANGLMFDARGRLVACEGGNRRLVRIDGEKVEVLADRWEGKRLNSPNDLSIDARGGIYFTDPRYGGRDDLELDVEAVYYVTPEGKLLRVIDDLKRPNGLILSNDGKTLYVADEPERKIMAYDVREDGTLANGREFASMDPKARGGPDGMTVDERGNVYAAGQGGIWIWSPGGKLVKRVEVPENPANCAFGGKDRKTLYVTARTSLYRIGMRVAGR